MFCNRTKEFLRKHNVAFTDRDITTDEKALDELTAMGLMTTPVIVIDGERVVGYDVPRLTVLLGL
ncbi:MAG: glutaredoxin family protein [Vicinamibacterales bacterium]